MEAPTMRDAIVRKRDGGANTAADFGLIAGGAAGGSIPDYQLSAWLMAALLRGMTPEETLELTRAMRDSGRLLHVAATMPGPSVDKHSTGGVGDKVSLLVVPMLAACGVRVLKMSGRGLGYSGGTADKLAAIPGFRTDLTADEAMDQLRSTGALFVEQSDELVPADRKLYALRDVTGTVESIPLIAASVMSKKLAIGAGAIVLDVKAGRGAFMHTTEDAERLARAMVAIGSAAGTRTVALVTDMDRPLGRTVGNALEVREAILALQHPSTADPRLLEICRRLAAEGLVASSACATADKASDAAADVLATGRAASALETLIRAQGGPPTLAETLQSLPTAPRSVPVLAERAGWVTDLDAGAAGRLAVRLGAGREVADDPIDPSVGIEIRKQPGERVEAGGELGRLHLADRSSVDAGTLAAEGRDIWTIGSSPATPGRPVVQARVPDAGIEPFAR